MAKLMTDHLAAVAEAFSRKATVYDAFGEGHPNLSRMREKVYAHSQSVVSAGSYLLELNAGTGLDAAALAQRGYRIHATDLAPGMVAQIEAKIERLKLADRLSAQQCSFTALDQVECGPFDAVISNFGGLNCIADLSEVTGQLPRLLKPGGCVVFTIMPPICLWELARIGRDLRTATRRLHKRGITSRVEGVEFTTHYFTPQQTRRAFGPTFRLIRLEGLSVLTPPADHKSFAHQHPRLYRLLARLDDAVSPWRPFSGWGDFYILSMRYVP